MLTKAPASCTEPQRSTRERYAPVCDNNKHYSVISYTRKAKPCHLRQVTIEDNNLEDNVLDLTDIEDDDEDEEDNLSKHP